MPRLVAGDALRATARRLPGKTAFIFRDRRITYAAFEERVNRLANGLLGKGYSPGDHIAVLAYNCIEYFEILFALAKAGMTAVPVNFRLSESEIGYVIDQSDSRALIYEAAFRDKIRNRRAGFERIWQGDVVVFGGAGDPGDVDYEALLATSSPSDPEIPVDETTTWYIGYTSGTTGRPKGAMRSHRSNILLAANTFYLGEDDIILLIMPIFHSNSIWFGTISVYWGATTVIYPSGGFNPREILDTVQREKVTFSSMVPTMYSLILQAPDKENFDTRSLKTLLCSSAPLMTTTKEQILEFFAHAQLYEGYGATESGAVTLLGPRDQYRKVRSCGAARPFTRIKILDAAGNECAVGEVGELFAVSPGMFEGYYKQPEADAAAFRGEYLSVGDMATVDEEGYYYIVDRKHDMIISGGENIYPTEIDDVLSKHPKILQAAVIGVPDEKWGEAVKAVVVPKPGADVTEAEVIAYAKAHLAGYKCPKSVDFRDSLPTSPTGKILKREIRKIYWEGRDVQI
ncbi:MAG: long-chain-fatty-acid--CoA ligase [Deltaproteobacteria bacterium]|nr:long-chain-fatty-acid--CoA ligase [Deltaproteobacteria bacterium]